ncbi:molybdopterin-guanine dinucleotide biosynthesis protein B [Candidatus Bathyarchaeota archaeon]|nr:molybdopterin-guanine dinucleotide biosynthesis protein B [Candidatus Bathyarchaeota archaeon]
MKQSTRQKPIVIAVVGGKSSGKTTTVEALTETLTKKGYKVAAVKHIPEKDFTIDTKDKDTWRFAQSGAKTVVAISPNEIATIEKANISHVTLSSILERCHGNDIIIIEGFRKMLGKNLKVPKIVATKSAEEVSEALKTFKPIVAFTGPYQASEMASHVLYIDVLREKEKIADVVAELLKRGK